MQEHGEAASVAQQPGALRWKVVSAERDALAAGPGRRGLPQGWAGAPGSCSLPSVCAPAATRSGCTPSAAPGGTAMGGGRRERTPTAVGEREGRGLRRGSGSRRARAWALSCWKASGWGARLGVNRALGRQVPQEAGQGGHIGGTHGARGQPEQTENWGRTWVRWGAARPEARQALTPAHAEDRAPGCCWPGTGGSCSDT